MVSDDMGVVFLPDWHELLMCSDVTQGGSHLLTQFRFPHRIIFNGGMWGGVGVGNGEGDPSEVKIISGS